MLWEPSCCTETGAFNTPACGLGLGPAHRYVGFSGDHPGNFHALRLAQNCLAVTAACLAVDRHRFEEVGGFATQYPLAYNDVDLCFKLVQAGYRNVVDCATEIIHHESSSRDPSVQDWEVELLRRRLAAAARW